MFILKHAVVGNWKSWRKNRLMMSILFTLSVSIALLLVIYLTADSSVLNYQQKYGQQVMISLKEADQQHVQKLTKEQYQKFGESEYLKDMKLFSDMMVVLNQKKSTEFQENQDIRTMVTTILSGIDEKDFDSIKQSNEIIQGKNDLAEDECLISQEFSEMHNLGVGDTFSFQTVDRQGNLSQEFELFIAGIYKPKQNQREDNSYIQKFLIYTGMSTITSNLELTKNSDYSCLFELKDAKSLSAFKKELYQKGLPKSYEVTMSDETIQGYISQLEEVKRGTIIVLAIVLSFSVILLNVSIRHLFRKKEEEFFVLQELGMSKWKIFFYRAIALLSTTMGSFVLACLVVAVFSPTLLHWLSNYQSLSSTSKLEIVNASFVKSQDPIMEKIVSISTNDRNHFLVIFFGISLLLWFLMIIVEGYCIFKTKAMELLLERI